jgi:hypothetical protein
MAESLNGGLRQSGPVFLMQPAMHVEMKEAANRGGLTPRAESVEP